MRRAIVIGASSGLGFEVAKLLKSDGWRLGVAARRSDLLQRLGDDVETEALDVTDAGAETRLLALIERVGGMDLFFYASGIGRQNPQLEADVELATVCTNGQGFTRMIGTAFRYMAQNGGGHIAAITSIAGTKGLGPAPSYSATKAFQNVYLQALEQLANARRLNIRFTDIRPGFVATALLGDAPNYPLLMQPEAVARQMVKAIKKQRHIVVIDGRWRIITTLWRWIPNWIWRRLKLNAN
ncbi:MAG: SDR family NAD(P)-dependent oxidoreductase [Prevotella sp.]|nr:SDR family NAD(P)-dependent oxidoreductase [Prevotella sp.]